MKFVPFGLMENLHTELMLDLIKNNDCQINEIKEINVKLQNCPNGKFR